MARLDRPRFTRPKADRRKAGPPGAVALLGEAQVRATCRTADSARRPGFPLGPWPEGPWWLLGLASGAAPAAVVWQGGDLHVALLASVACLATPGAAIEALLGLARLALAMAPPPR